jgi:hypothetical protein
MIDFHAVTRSALDTTPLIETETATLDDASLLAMLESRLSDLDSQVGQITRTLQSKTAEAQRLGRQAQVLQAVRELLSDRAVRNDDGSFKLDAEVPGGFHVLCERLGIDDPNGWAEARDANGDHMLSVGEFLDAIQVDGGSLGAITSPEGLQLRAESLGEALRQCNSGNEQLMVRLQSTMQQRTQAVTMATNMLKALDEARDAVVGNLR